MQTGVPYLVMHFVLFGNEHVVILHQQGFSYAFNGEVNVCNFTVLQNPLSLTGPLE